MTQFTHLMQGFIHFFDQADGTKLNDNILVDGNDNSSDPTGATLVRGLEGNDSLGATPSKIGDPGITLDGGTGTDSAIVNLAFRTENWDLTLSSTMTIANISLISIEKLILTLGDGNDHIEGSAIADNVGAQGGQNTLIGNDGNDFLAAGDGKDVFDGGYGNDTILCDTDIAIETGGNDQVKGGLGDDSIHAGGGDDRLDGGPGSDHLDGGFGNDTVTYQFDLVSNISVFLDTGVIHVFTGLKPVDTDTVHSIENVEGTVNADVIGGDDKANDLKGGGGDDKLMGGLGNDAMTGSVGDDTIEGGGGIDRMDGGTGIDTLSYENSPYALTIDLSKNKVLFKGQPTDIISNFEHVIGGGQKEIITGNAEANSIDGGGGDDELHAFGKTDEDIVNGGLGNDKLFATVGGWRARLSGEDGNDTITCGAADDLVFGGDGNDLVKGGSGDVTVFDSKGSDTFIGGAGDDFVLAGQDDDALSGNGGIDLIGGQEGNDTIDGGAGSDFLFGFLALTKSNFEQQYLHSTTNLETFGVLYFKEIGGIDTAANTIKGGLGNDFIVGANGADLLKGEAGEDSLFGGNGQDTLDGGADGGNRLEGMTGNDLMIARPGDKLYGDEGIDTADFSAVGISLSINLNLFTFNGGGLIDAENVVGARGNDQIIGSKDANNIAGGIGLDTLSGGAGADTLAGGAGRDAFLFNTAISGASLDRITDFSTVDDTLRLDQTIFAALKSPGPLKAGMLRVATVAADHKALDADDFLIYNKATGGLYYDSDASKPGHSPVEFAVLSPHLTLTVNDFLIVA